MRLSVAALALLVAAPQDGRFEAYDLFIETDGRPLAAFQVEITYAGKVVGIERGELSEQPPYHDPAALAGGRLVVAQYTLAEAPPAGRVRAATLHFFSQSDVRPEATLSVAAAPGGEPIRATVLIVHRGGNR